jgi:hypothetical protein
MKIILKKGNIEIATENQFLFLPTCGITWNERKICIAFAWLNIGGAFSIKERKNDQ